MEPSTKLQYVLLFTFSTLLRYSISLAPFSGQFNAIPPPGQAAYGDFECHRTWLSVTNKLPFTQWYKNTTHSNVSYWPLDYPPLCMEVHYVMSKSIEYLEPQALDTIGYMEPRYVWLMRTWVIILEYLVFVPGAIFFLQCSNGKVTPIELAVIVSIPASMLVDNAHF